jgi:hypothetical protein
MTLREKFIAAAAIVLFVLVIFGYRAWLAEHDARTKAESVQDAQQTLIDEATHRAEAAKADAAKVASDLQAQLAAIEAEKKQPVTAPQFVVDLNKLIPNLPQPAVVVQPPATTRVVNGKPETVQPPLVVQIPSADLQDLKAYKLGCDANAVSLSACYKTAADEVAQLSAAEVELAAIAKDRDAWKTAAGKGNLWHRLGKRVKCLAIVGGASALGAWADKQQTYRGAAIGATAGGVGCELF